MTHQKTEKTTWNEDNYRAWKAVDQVYDLKTGQELFHPKISEISNWIANEKRAYNNNRRSIHEELYKNAEITKQKEAKRKRQEEEQREAKTHGLNYRLKTERTNSDLRGFKKSIEINSQIQEKRIREIFTLIDDDGDGLISSQRIDITQLDNTIIDILTPCFYKIEEENLTLNSN